jgi:F-type H+-transporting ATPase subunit b
MTNNTEATIETTKSPSIFDSLGINTPSLVFYMICFLITFVALYYFLFKPLLKYVRDKTEQVNNVTQKEQEYLNGIQELSIKKIELQEEYYKAKIKAVQEGKEEGLLLKEKIINEANENAQNILEQAKIDGQKVITDLKSQSEKDILQVYNQLITTNLQTLTVDPDIQKQVLDNLLKQPIKQN